MFIYLHNSAYNSHIKFCDRTQADPKYRDAITTVINILQARIIQSLDTAAAAQDFFLSSLINDPTPEQHAATKALRIFQTLLEHVAGTIDPVFETALCVSAIGRDYDLRAWFNNAFDYAKENLMKEGCARAGLRW